MSRATITRSKNIYLLTLVKTKRKSPAKTAQPSHWAAFGVGQYVSVDQLFKKENKRGPVKKVFSAASVRAVASEVIFENGDVRRVLSEAGGRGDGLFH